MKFRWLVFFVSFFLMVAGCSGGGGGDDDDGRTSNTGNDIVLSENTRVLETDTVVNTLLSVSEDGQTMTFSDAAEIRDIEVGDIIVTGVSEVTPEGFLKRVASKTFYGGEVVFETEPAALADVFESASFSVSEPMLGEGDGTEITEIADGVTFVDTTTTDRMIIDMVRKTVELDITLIGTENAGISVQGSFELTLSVDLDWDIDGHSLQMLNVIPQLSGNLEAKVVANMETDDFVKRIKLFTVKKTQIYMFGYVPVVVTYKVPIYLTFKGKAEVGVEAGAVAGLTIKGGFLYQKGQGVNLVGDVVPQADWIYPTVYMKLTGKFGPSSGVGIILYGTASIEATIDSGVKLELNPELSMDPCAEARLLFNASLYSGSKVKVDFTVFDRELWAEEFTVNEETEYLPFSTTLFQSNENPVPSIEFPDTSELYVGTPVHFTQNSTDPDGTIVSYLWDFDDDSTSNSPQETHIYQNPGTYNFSLTVEDNNGCSVTEDMFISIDQAGPPAEHGTVAGAVRDAVSNIPLSGVSVVASLGGLTIDTVTSNANGDYTMSLPEASGYVFQFSRSGFMSATYRNINVAGNDNTYLEAVLQIDNAFAGSGTISGMITNALTGQGVSGVTVALRQGINVTSGTVVASTQSGSGGTYSITDISAGHYTAELSFSGYNIAYMTVVCLGNTTNPNQNGSVTPILSSEEVRVILTWGANPSDLDSHMTLPDPYGDRLHVYYSNKSVSIDETEVANLDVDDIFSYGPETITLYRAVDGLVRYSVHDWSNCGRTSSTALGASGAKVEVYRGSSLVARYNVPNQAGTLWTVFELENGQIQSVNTMSYESSPANVRSLILDALLQNDADLIRTQFTK